MGDTAAHEPCPENAHHVNPVRQALVGALFGCVLGKKQMDQSLRFGREDQLCEMGRFGDQAGLDSLFHPGPYRFDDLSRSGVVSSRLLLNGFDRLGIDEVCKRCSLEQQFRERQPRSLYPL